MKKILFILLIILITFPLMSQELGLSKNNKSKQIENFFSTDTVKTDTVYIIEYRYYDNYYSFNRQYYDFYWSYQYNWNYYNWFYMDYYWFYTHNWHYDNYHRHYSNYHHNYTYKPRPHKPIRQRTIATTIRIAKPDVKPDIRPVRTTNSRYDRPSTYQAKSRNVRQPITYTRPTTNRPTSTYNRPFSNTRSTNTVRSSNTRSTGNNSGSTNRSSSGSRGRR